MEENHGGINALKPEERSDKSMVMELGEVHK
jgi:hypothetical protein